METMVIGELNHLTSSDMPSRASGGLEMRESRFKREMLRTLTSLTANFAGIISRHGSTETLSLSLSLLETR